MKINKLGKMIAIIIISILLIEILTPVVSYAGFLDGVAGESGSRPSPPPSSGGGSSSSGGGSSWGGSHGGSSGGGSGSGGSSGGSSSGSSDSDSSDDSGDDGGGDSSDGTTTPDDSDDSEDTPSGPPAPTITYVNRYVGIKGNAYEDLGYNVSSFGGSDNTKETIPIGGITVQLCQGDSVVAETLTADDGSYSFEPSPGTYSIRYIYGKTEGADQSLYQKILKYNGQDYITVQTPQNQTYLDTERVEVEQSGKGVLQLYIALDCSYSMRDPETTVNYNGKNMTRLEVVVDSAKELCRSLIDSGDNIYIGLIFFSGTNYRAVSLTKNLNNLTTALDSIVSNGWYTANTDVFNAADKAYQSFYNNDPENSNRFITILSDGVPTSDGTTMTYSDDTADTMYQKLDIIAESTAQKLQSLRSDGVKIVSLITKSTDPEETDYVNRVFDGDSSDIFETIEDGYKTVEMITEKLKNYIISETQDKEYNSERQIIAGYEDEERRKEVDEQFELMDYNNTSMFKQVDEYTSQEEVAKLSDATYMLVHGGSGYVIEDCPSSPTITTAVWPETGETYTSSITYYVPVYYTGQDITLARRPAFALVTKITATGIRIILQNGQVLDTQTREAGADFPILESLDNELAYGATIQIEYTVSIKNDSSIQCDHLEILNYLPKDFVFDPDITLISENKKNSDTGWESASLEELKSQNLVTQETVDKYGSNVTLKLERDNNGEGENGFYIAPGGEFDIRYVVSRMISNLDDIEDGDFEIASEVLKYGNHGNRRMQYANADTSSITKSLAMVGANVKNYLGAYPGDSKDMDYSDESTNVVIVIPPTGKETIDVPRILASSILTLILDEVTY